MIGETRHVAQGILEMLPTEIVNSKSRLPQAGEISEQGVQDTVQFKDCWLWFSLWGWWANWFTHAMSVITLREITAATVRVICALETREEQKRFVAPNALSIAQAYFEPRAIFRAVYADEVPVGFVMWKPTDETEVAYLWRFMIDHNHQKMGHAKQAITQLIDLLRDAGYRRMQTSVVLGDGGPLDFYRSIGFVETDAMLSNGERVLTRSL
jgi:diamine N-acetyltransferase